MLQPTDCTAPFCVTASVLGSWRGVRGVGSSWMAGSNSVSSPGMNLRFAGGDFFALLFPLCLFLRFEPACFAGKLSMLSSTDTAEAALDESELAGGV